MEPGGAHPALTLALLLTAAGCAAAATRLALLADAARDLLWRWMALGLALAAVAYLNYALVPSQLTELLHAGDVFLLLAYGVLLLGAVKEITSTEAALVRSAVSSERTRVADELRAGIAQELAFMASQTGILARRPVHRPALDELADSVERALDESRGAISALLRPVDQPLGPALAEVAREVAAEGGASIELDLAPEVELDRTARDALLRLVHDCLVDATRHRGARRLLLELRGVPRVTVRIIDDGRTPAPDALAQRALRERAEAIAATVSVAPVDGGGTLLELTLG